MSGLSDEPSHAEQRDLAPPSLAEGAHKGDTGRVLCLVGSRLMPGAALLVARAAQRAGAGLVTVGCQDEALLGLVPASAPEAVLLDLSRVPEPTFALGQRADHAVVCGCGLGQEPRARKLVEALFPSNLACPLVLDADALNILADAPEQIRAWRGPVVITPHPGEATRLLGREVPADDQARLAAARELAERTGAIAVLKGHRTVVAHGTRVYVNDTGNAGMATAGAGDVLAGILGAYLAACGTGAFPRWTPLDAACAAVRVHGLAGDVAASHLGRRALIASDLIAWLPAAQRRLES
jgi:NAD(P)H-hydrate epimerase